MPKIKTCPTCNTQFTLRSTSPRQVYCSLECYWKLHRVPEVKCANCGSVSRVTRRGTHQPRKYCSQRCYLETKRNGIVKLCPVCNSDFTVPASNASRYTVCSIVCRKALETIEDKPCPRCGKVFRGGARRRYCGELCYRPPIYRPCKTCSASVRCQPADIDRAFCNISCYRRYVGSTSIEDQVALALESLCLGYECEVKIGRYSCDFLIRSQRVIIEADGTYWHSFTVDRDDRKDRYLVAHGYKVLRLPETTITSMSLTQLSHFISSAITGKADLFHQESQERP